MALSTAVASAALLLLTADVCLTGSTMTAGPGGNSTSSANSTNSTDPSSAPETSTPPLTRSELPPPALGFLTIQWDRTCEGAVVLHHSGAVLPVCFASDTTLLHNVCDHRPGCDGFRQWAEDRKHVTCSKVTGPGAVEKQTSTLLRVRCKGAGAIPAALGQLQTYKVMTALLCCVLVIIVLIRFTKPTVKALQNRLSNRRQNRWIGPTQSHSVSYQRGKTVKPSDGEKRLSYPALERLMVSDSREPSSNRNSYNF